MTTTFQVSALVKDYRGGHRALAGVDLTVGPGEVVALLGPNGSGKSTLFRCALRLVEPTAGRVVLCGIDVTEAGRRELRDARRHVGVVFQRFHLIGRLSAFHNVLLGALGHSRVREWWPCTASDAQRSAAMACLERVGLVELANQRADSLSGGQAQRVAIARMLMQGPSVVLADEPVASLDPAAAVSVMELLSGVARERGLATVITLHQLDHAMRFCDRVVGLRAGSVLFDRPVRELPQDRLDILYERGAA